MKKISVIVPCKNEELNIKNCYDEIKKVLEKYNTEFDYEIIFIDNASNDKTVEEIKKLTSIDKKLKAIINSRDFGQVRSPYYAMLQATGDVIISVNSDMQTPINLIEDFVEEWKKGYLMVLAIRNESHESLFLKTFKNLYYKILAKISNVDVFPNFIGFGLYDSKIIEIFRKIKTINPYLRGMVSEVGFKKKFIYYDEPKRIHGKTKNNFFSFLDLALIGFTSYSKAPLRLVTLVGTFFSLIFFTVSLIYLILKIIYWNEFELGFAPILIGIFFIGSIQLLSIGVIGEYIGAIFEDVKDRPIVIEKERINFDK